MVTDVPTSTWYHTLLQVATQNYFSATQEGRGNEGMREADLARCLVVFCGKTNRVFMTGFALWDSSDLSKPLNLHAGYK